MPAVRRPPLRPLLTAATTRGPAAQISSQAAAAAALAGEVAGGGVDAVHEVHRAIADRVFARAPAPRVRHLHDGISAGVYTGVRGAVRAGGAMSARLLAEREGSDWQATPTGARAVAALNAAVGDRLDADGSPLAIPMAYWRDGRALPASTDDLVDRVPASPTLVVFLHGLGETEHFWRLVRDAEGRRAPGYAERLENDLGVACLTLRYNTGLHISSNGRLLAQLLAATVAAWPVPLQRLCLVGHSMGGLVARSACQAGIDAGHDWTGLLTDVVALGAPHNGAPLEKVANLADHLLRLIPETRPVARALRTRSSGVKDLRYGYLSDTDWDGADPDGLLRDCGIDLPPVPGVRHHVVWAVLTRDPASPLGALVGDLLVWEGSAVGRARRSARGAFTPVGTLGIGGSHHFRLLNHEGVYDALQRWLSVPPS